MHNLKRMKELTDILNKAAKAYYSTDTELMSDREYDMLYDELKLLEQQTGTIMASSPTQKVGFEVMSELAKHAHEYKLLSLDKTKEVSKLKEFLSKGDGLLSHKLDGLTVVLTYNGGSLTRAVTRGNGEIGELITHNALTFKNVPGKINFRGSLTLRGEAVISFSDFASINEALEEGEKYKNPRNLTSGTVRQLNSEICASRNVAFLAHELVFAEEESFKKRYDQFERLESLGFVCVEHRLVNAENVQQAVEDFKEGIDGYEYATDGLVLTYNDIALSESLGQTSKFPKHSVAFKWEDEQAETVLTDIVWNTSRTGLINPVAVFEPVDLLGTTVSRASIHNVSILESLRLGKGDKILVYKANMIIPQIADNITKSGSAEIPERCPVCGFDTEIEQRADVKSLYCTNPNCQAQLIRSLAHYSARDAMNIEGFSVQTIERFVQAGILKSYADIYSVGLHEQSILGMDGFGKKSFKKLCDAIEESKTCECHRFIYALGIKNIGLAAAKLLCRHFENDLVKIMSSEADELLKIDGFGEVMSVAVKKYFEDERNRELVNFTVKILDFIKPVTSEAQTLAGKTFVITGTLKNYGSRDELVKVIENLGGKVLSSVSAKTSFLINNDSKSLSSKNKKAAELGVPVITEEEFAEIAGLTKDE